MIGTHPIATVPIAVNLAPNVPAPVANFSGTPLFGSAPFVVQFTDLSTNSPTSWLWNFGDGTTSELQNPSHTYANAGQYTVTLTATNAGGSNSVTMTNYVTVATKPKPDRRRDHGGVGDGRRRARQNSENEQLAKRRRQVDIAVALMFIDED